MILFESNLVKVEYDKKIPAVIWTCLENALLEPAEFQEPFVPGVKFYVEKKKALPKLGWINDLRKFKGVRPQSVSWLDENVNDKVSVAGSARVAFVLPTDMFGRMAIRLYAGMSMRRKSEFKPQIKTFNTVEESENWIRGYLNS